MLSLRPYQQRAIADLRGAYAKGARSPLLVLPTGAGKTVVAAEIIRSAIAKGRRVLVLVHRNELITQTVSKLEAAGVLDIRVIQASNDIGNPIAPVTVASVPTLTMPRWLERLPRADLIVCDEAHHFVAITFNRILVEYPGALALGLSATPQRSDGQPLGDVFDALVVGATVKELTDLEHLVPCRVWAPPLALETAEMALSPVEAYTQHAAGGRAVVFCVTVEHATRVADEMNAAGIPSEVVSGKGSADRRADTLKRFRAGELRAVVNVHVLTEGWDDPGCSVCILARKPQHAGTFLQMAGRVLRPSPGKTQALLIDLCGSVHDHGTPDMEREYTLDGKGISKAKREPIRQCPTCGSVFLSAAVCPHCGVELPSRPAASPHSVGVGVVDISTLPKLPPRAITLSIVSKYPGRCRVCFGSIAVGDQIYWTKGMKPRHAQCGAATALNEANELLRRAGS